MWSVKKDSKKTFFFLLSLSFALPLPLLLLWLVQQKFNASAGCSTAPTREQNWTTAWIKHWSGASQLPAFNGPWHRGKSCSKSKTDANREAAEKPRNCSIWRSGGGGGKFSLVAADAAAANEAKLQQASKSQLFPSLHCKPTPTTKPTRVHSLVHSRIRQSSSLLLLLLLACFLNAAVTLEVPKWLTLLFCCCFVLKCKFLVSLCSSSFQWST